MKTATCYLLIFISLLELMAPVNTAETLDSLLEKKIKKLLHCGDDCPFSATKSLSCTSVTATGTLASCPAGADVCVSCDHAGMAVTGCACGYGCGSWDVQNGNTCHCQCKGMDWTTARCCQLA